MRQYPKKFLGPGLLVHFRGDDQEYTIKNISPTQQDVFVWKSGQENVGKIFKKKIKNIFKINRQPVTIIESQIMTTKEKKAAISLIEAKIERLSGKKVKYIDPQEQAKKNQAKKIQERLEKLTGKKIISEMYEDEQEPLMEHHLNTVEEKLDFLKTNQEHLSETDLKWIDYIYKEVEKRMGIDEALDKDPSLDPVGQEDADIDNDGNIDASDQYLKHRRDIIAKKVHD